MRPKPMVEIGGKPMLWHIMKIYSAHGINEFVICLGYKGYVDQGVLRQLPAAHVGRDVRSAQRQRRRCTVSTREPWRVTLVDTGEQTMTGGRLRRVLALPGDEEFCLTYGDGVADIDIGAADRLPSRAGRALHGDRGAAARSLRGARDRRRARAQLRGEAAGRRRLDQRRLLRAARAASASTSTATRRSGSRSRSSARARRRAGVLPPHRLLAGDGHAARPQPPGGAVASRAARRGGHGRRSPAFWRGRRVLLTGHTGFKGSWLSLWLQALGADVTGFSRRHPDRARRCTDSHGSATRSSGSRRTCATTSRCARPSRALQPEVVIHMAAQSLVRRSYVEPARDLRDERHGHRQPARGRSRDRASVRVVVNVTSDKCYENREWEWGYREDEPMGGHDPYSNSKGCAELVTAAYRRSFFSRAGGARAGLGAGRQRDRRRRLGRGPARARPHARVPRRRSPCGCATRSRSGPGSTC